ncbi:MAG: HAD family phosphatase [Oscillibacter sp.]|jgi:HAD superfamily hydrolase (TIGR01509 family)|nr:HAD family phosphatase [Oscillibacter sp.]
MLLFDMDGTLIDSNGIWKEVDRTFLARRGLPYTHAYYEGVAHTIFPKAAAFTKQFCHLSESTDEIMAEWMTLAEGLYAKVAVKPGVRAYLKQCRAEGRRMSVVTSSVPIHCKTALAHLDLLKYFDHITFAHDLDLDKQEPEVWLAAAAENGVDAAECTVFDDSIAALKGARSAKMRTVGVYDPFFAQDEAEMRGFCDVYIKSFEELLLPEKKV